MAEYHLPFMAHLGEYEKSPQLFRASFPIITKRGVNISFLLLEEYIKFQEFF